MLNFASKHFKIAMSVKPFEPLYKINKNEFISKSNIKVFLGDSSLKLDEMLKQSVGRILFWLDGQCSGEGTAYGTQTSPIISELEIIKNHQRKDHCILIDDARHFTGKDGYPTLEKTKETILSINKNYRIYIDSDCIVAININHS